MYTIETTTLGHPHTMKVETEAEAREIAKLNPGASWYRG
jgi:hypothetical protein